jgi:hypothetical protein
MVADGGESGAARSDASSTLVIGSQLDLDRNHYGFADRLARLDVPLQPLRDRQADSLDKLAGWWEREGESGKWHRARAHGLRLKVSARWQHGQDNRLQLMHRETGELGRAVCTCRQRICEECERARAAALSRRIAQVAAVHDDAQGAEGREPALITLTLRDSGSPGEAVQLMRAAWPLFHRALADAGGSMGKGGAWVRAEEYTDGTRGHLHWHVVCWLPEWVDYAAMHRAWWRALVVAAERLGVPDLTTGYTVREPSARGGWGQVKAHWRAGGDCGCDEDDGMGRQRDRCGDEPCARHTPGAVNVQRRRADEPSSEAAAGYMLKAAKASGALVYALKGGGDAAVDVTDDQVVERFAEYLAGQFGKRRYQGSVYFWRGGRLAPGVPVVTPEPSEWAPLAALTGEWPPPLRTTSSNVQSGQVAAWCGEEVAAWCGEGVKSGCGGGEDASDDKEPKGEVAAGTGDCAPRCGDRSGKKKASGGGGPDCAARGRHGAAGADDPADGQGTRKVA